MSTDLRSRLDAFHRSAASGHPLPTELVGLLGSVRELLKRVAGLWELVPIGSRITRTHIDAKSTYDYLALSPSFPEDMMRPRPI